MAPAIREAWQVELGKLNLIEAEVVRDIVLLHDGKAWAAHSGIGEALQKLLVEVFVSVLVDRELERAHQAERRAEDDVALATGDDVGHVPGKLLERADEGLVRTLRTLAREGRALRRLGVLDKHVHLFLADEAAEELPGSIGRRLEQARTRPIPADAARQREELAQQVRLARQRDRDRTVTKPSWTRLGNVGPVTLDGAHGVVERHELNIGIVSLGRHAVHDYVDGLIHVVENARVAPEQRDDLGAAGRERDLVVLRVSASS